MKLEDYIKNTGDTWNYSPVEMHMPLADKIFDADRLYAFNLLLQRQNALIGVVGEFNEFLYSTYAVAEKMFDELGDVMYYLARVSILFDIDIVSIFANYTIPSQPLDLILKRIVEFTATKFFDNIKKPIYRQGKDFNYADIEEFVNNLIEFILNFCDYWHIDLTVIMQENYNKLHNIENLKNRGLTLN